MSCSLLHYQVVKWAGNTLEPWKSQHQRRLDLTGIPIQMEASRWCCRGNIWSYGFCTAKRREAGGLLPHGSVLLDFEQKLQALVLPSHLVLVDLTLAVKQEARLKRPRDLAHIAECQRLMEFCYWIVCLGFGIVIWQLRALKDLLKASLERWESMVLNLELQADRKSPLWSQNQFCLQDKKRFRAELWIFPSPVQKRYSTLCAIQILVSWKPWLSQFRLITAKGSSSVAEPCGLVALEGVSCRKFWNCSFCSHYMILSNHVRLPRDNLMVDAAVFSNIQYTTARALEFGGRMQRTLNCNLCSRVA